MTREEFINWFEERFALTKNNIYEFGQLYDEVTKPRWISVEEELPKEHEWILGFSLKRSYIDVYNFDSNGLFEAHDITHWMHLSPPPILTNSENTGKKGGEE